MKPPHFPRSPLFLLLSLFHSPFPYRASASRIVASESALPYRHRPLFIVETSALFSSCHNLPQGFRFQRYCYRTKVTERRVISVDWHEERKADRMGVRPAGCERVPDAVFAKIFALLPASQIASSCALVCKAWRDSTHDATLWSDLCVGSGLRALDAMRCMGGWKGLFGSVYGVNLVASPHFERIHHIDAERIKGQSLRPWEPKHRVLYDRICSVDEDHDEPHPFCHWATEGGSVFQRGGGDGVLREYPPIGCPPCPVAKDKPVLATSYEWGKVQQYVGLQTFSNKFLDSCPAMLFSVWFAGRQSSPSSFKIQVILRDELKNVIFCWDSGELMATENEWKQEKHIIHSYPVGLRSMVVKVAGKSTRHGSGFYGAKCTAAKLHFVPVHEVKFYLPEDSSSQDMIPSP